MNLDFMPLFVLLAPAAFLFTALISWFQPGLKPWAVKKAGIASSIFSILIAASSGFFVVQYGLLESPLLGMSEIGFSVRLDSLSILMFSMIAILGFIVVRFSLNYLDGDERQGRFIGRLAATIAAVQLLVLAGNLGLLLVSWILTSISLHRLLVFYKNRPGAIIAARKKFLVARIADACLLTAVLLLYFQFETGNLEVIFQAIKQSLSVGIFPTNLEAAALLLALAALFKSAQFPTHGWLIEVMETPTPVSALLHAGLLNAGPFLLIRMAFVMEASTYASILIIIVGAFTALFASIAFLTQTSIKTALGYSSVAHMGFSLLICGLGVYPAAMLHLIAHSFYKAHSFLSSGSVIDVIRASKIKKSKRTGSLIRIALGFVMAMAVYMGFAFVWGIDLVHDFSLLAIGGIIVMGLSTIFTSALDSDSNRKVELVFRATILAIIVSAAFFILESGTHHLLAAQLPAITRLSFVEILLISFVIFAFGVVVFVQIIAPALPAKPFYRILAIHFRNGFYANALFDRIVKALRIDSVTAHARAVEKIEIMRRYEPIETERFEEQTA